MSKRGVMVNGGGSSGRGSKISGRSGGSGPSAAPTNNFGRDSHFKLMGTDAKYGMLMWQSKLQDKFLQEQKEKKQLRETPPRRKSDEDYNQRSHRPVIRGPFRGPVRVGSGGQSSKQDSETHSKEQSERRIEISRDFVSESESSELGALGATNPSPTPNTKPEFIVTAQGPQGQELSAKFSEAATTATTTKYYGATPNNVDNEGAGETFNPRQTFYYNNHHDNNPTSSYRNRYEFPQTPNPTSLPKIVQLPDASTSGMPKIVSNSISCDNLNQKPSSQNSYYNNNYSANVAFFGLGNLGFGSGTGAGAPRRSPSGRLMTNLQGHPDIRYHQKNTTGFDKTLRYMMDKERIHQYKEDLDKQVLENTRLRGAKSPLVNDGSVGGPIKIMSSHENLHQGSFYGFYGENGESRRTSRNGVELAPLIRKYKSLPKLATLSSTDVTKISPRKGDYSFSPEPEEIAKGLSMQLAEKHKIQQIEEEKERRENERHFSTWDSFWGRPGHGAPIFYTKNGRIGASTPSLVTPRSDLFKALHMTHQQNRNN